MQGAFTGKYLRVDLASGTTTQSRVSPCPAPAMVAETISPAPMPAAATRRPGPMILARLKVAALVLATAASVTGIHQFSG